MLAIILLSIIIINPKITTYEENKKIAIVFDLSKSSSWLLDFYKSIDTKNFDKFELGDSIYKFKSLDFKYNITNLNALSYLKNYEKIVYIGDGWHNYPQEIDYNNFNIPIYVIYPNIKIEQISIKNVIYPKSVFPNELFQTYFEIFSNKDTTINIEISLDTSRISKNLKINKGLNSYTFLLKSPGQEGYYKINVKFLNRQKAYALNVKEIPNKILINVYKVTPEIGLLNRALKEMGYEVILNLKGEKINKEFILTIGYGKDNGEDLIFLDNKDINFKWDERINQISGIYKNRVFVLSSELWKRGRYEFNEYKNVILPIINTAINLKPMISVNYNVFFNKVYMRISSNNPDVKFYAKNKEIPNYYVFEIKKEETLQILGILNNRKVYQKQFILKPDTLSLENEEGIDSLTLSSIVNKTGGKFIKSLNEIEIEKRKVEKEIFNNLFWGFLVIFLLLIDFTLRRIFGFR
ncbi:MAG: hypothetical protein ABIL89_04875 [candidate division WOR-3 bacterium]|jgi:hypothetical protein